MREMKHRTEACIGGIQLGTEALIGSIQRGTEALSGRIRMCLHVIDYTVMYHVGVTTVADESPPAIAPKFLAVSPGD